MALHRGVRAGVAALALVVLGAAAGSAQAVTRDEANAIALAELAPDAQPGPLVVFGLAAPVAARRSVTEYATGAVLKRPGRKAWLYWEDLDPGARFAHASEVVVVDDATGRVTLRRSLQFYPLVDGRPPAYLGSPTAYADAAFHVFAKHGGPPAVGRIPDGPRRAPLTVPPGTFRDDCMLVVIMTPKNGVEKSNAGANLNGWTALARSLGFPVWIATAAGPVEAGASAQRPPSYKGQVNASTLAKNVKALVDDGCKDVMIVVEGHGYKPPLPAGIVLGEQPLTKNQRARGVKPKLKTITPEHLVSIVRVNAERASFKFVFDACYSGRFVQSLDDQPNVQVVTASSAPDEASYFNLKHVLPDDAPTPLVANDSRSEFMHGMIEGMRSVAFGPASVTGLAQLIKDGFAVEKPNDRAATVEQTHPVVADNLTAAATSCSGEFLPFDATEVAFVIECQVMETTPPGRPAPRAQLAGSRFDIRLPGNRQVTNWLGPAGFSCAPRTRVTANDSLSCTGTLNAGTPVGGNIRMSPGPVTGMGGQLFVTVGAAERGPFAITGP